MILATILTVFIILGIALRLAVPSLTRDSVATGAITVNGESRLGDCPNTPNCQGSESSRGKQTVQRLQLTNPAGDALGNLATLISSEPGAAIAAQDDRYLHVTFTSRIMGYVDDVEFLISDDKQSIQIRSASRLGKSDLGANAKRIAHLRQLSNGVI